MQNTFKALQEAIKSRDELSIMLLQNKIDSMLFDIHSFISANGTIGNESEYNEYLNYIRGKDYE